VVASDSEPGQSPRDEPGQTPRKPERCTPFAGGGKRRCKPARATEAKVGAEARKGCFALTIAGDVDTDDDTLPLPRRTPMAALRLWRPAASAPNGKATAEPAADGSLKNLRLSEPSSDSSGFKVSPIAPAASWRTSGFSSQKSTGSSTSMCGARGSRTSAGGSATHQQPRRQPQINVDASCRRSDVLTNSTPMV